MGTQNTPRLWGWCIIILGIALLICGENLFFQWMQIYWLEQLLTALGSSLFCLGVVTCIIDMQDWREYFASRLKEIVLEQSYLNTLSEENLNTLQVKIFKARFHNDKIDEEGSFLDYWGTMLQPIINEPYRKNVKQELSIYCDRRNPDKIYVKDIVSYICCHNGGRGMPEIRFSYTPKEQAEIKHHQIYVQYPLGHSKVGQREALRARVDNDADGNYVYKCDLSSISVDGLLVIKESTHHMNLAEFQTWEMAHITKDFTFTARYPDEFNLQFKPYVFCQELSRTSRVRGYLNYEYRSWMLPHHGVVWKLNPKSIAPAQNSESPSAEKIS